MCNCESPSQQCTHLTTLTVPYHQHTTYFDRHELSHLPYQKKRTLTTLTTQDWILITVCSSPMSWVGTTSKLKWYWSVLQQGRLPMTSIILFVQCTGMDNNNAFTWVTWELCGIRVTHGSLLILCGDERPTVHRYRYTHHDILISRAGGYTPPVSLHSTIVLRNIGLYFWVFITSISFFLFSSLLR